MSNGRRRFTDEFKREAVKLCTQPGAVVTHVARNLGVDQSVLRRWVQQQRGGVMEMNPSKPLRSETASRKVYPARDDARADVFDYIERFYNQRRRHSTLDFVSPVQFEQGLMGQHRRPENWGKPKASCRARRK